MTEGEKERIKHQAAFWNGMAVACFAGFTFGAALNILREAGQDIDKLLMSAAIVGSGLVFANAFHRVGRTLLRQID